MMIRGFWQQLQRGSASFRGDLGPGLLFYGLGARPPTCDPGAGLNKTEPCFRVTSLVDDPRDRM